MLNKTKIVLALVCLWGACCGVSATPILLINVADGDAHFDVASGLFTAQGTVIDAHDISLSLPAVTTVSLSAQFSSAAVISDPTGDSLLAQFVTATGTDVQVGVLGDGSLLRGEFSDLTMRGGIGLDFGALLGTINITGGALATDFGVTSDLITLQFNMTQPFAADLFSHDFAASLDGSIARATPVPGPAALLLLPLGLFSMAALRRRTY